MIKEYKRKRKKFITDFNNNLHLYTANLPSVIKTHKTKLINSTSWFEINKIKADKTTNNCNINTKFPTEVISCQKIKMMLTNTQKLIVNQWFQSYTEMYNKTLQYIRDNCGTFKNEVIREKLKDINRKLYVNPNTLRTKLKIIRDDIINSSQLVEINTNTKIQTHTLDYAIRQLVSNIKSAMTNLSRGYIKRFRIKFWKNNRPSKTIEIEKQYIRNNKVCPNILGNIKYEYNNKEYILDNISSNVKINYNSITNEYYLLVPVTNTPIKKKEKYGNFISLDPGLRTFMTGLSETDCFKIGTNVNSTIKKQINRINKIKANKNIPNKIKKKNEQLINRKIFNKVDDLQWKTIKFLTNNFTNILLGDMSAKSIVTKNKSVLNKDMKTACLRTRYYDFQKRLEYKCMLTKTNFKLVNECYTSKMCSLCGNYNDKLKGEKIYSCIKCKRSIDRDVNGCRNIMIKCLMEY
jgi:IS605 OrfB family transposase